MAFIYIYISPPLLLELITWVKLSCNAADSGQVELNVCAPAHTQLLASTAMSRDSHEAQEVSRGLV